MSLSPNDLINEALGLAYPYIGENATARGPLLSQLTSLEKEVADMIVATSPNLAATAGADITIVLATNPTGYTLDAAKAYLTKTFKYVDLGGNILPLRIVPDAQYAHPPTHPAAMIRGIKFFPCDPLEKAWAGSDARSIFGGGGDKVTYELVAEPAAVTTLAQTLVSPDLVRPYFVSSLALSVVLASDSVSPVSPTRLQQLTAAMMGARDGLPALLAQRARVESSIITEGEA